MKEEVTCYRYRERLFESNRIKAKAIFDEGTDDPAV